MKVATWLKDNDFKIKEQAREENLWRNYRISLDDHRELFEKQQYRCCTCSNPVTLRARFKGDRKAGHVDHDHGTGRIRGILCHNCNVALGMIHDNTATSQSMIFYLNK